MKLFIKGGRVLDPAQGIDALQDVLIERGKVSALLKPGTKVSGARVIDASGKWVTPGLIDIHVHLREPGEEYKETIATGAAAAVAGGFTAVACMANTHPVNDCAAVTDYILEQARHAGKARVYPVAALSKGLKGESLSEMGELAEHGCVAVSDDGRPVMNAELMRRALEYCKGLGIPVISHPEDLNLSAGGHMHEGVVCTELGLAGIPAAAEEVMVARDIILAELTGHRVHLAHLSTAGSVRMLREAKARGVPVSGETAPHYFTLCDEDVRGYHTNFKMTPPLRTSKDREAVLQGLTDGTIDAIASDHAPHSPVEKDVEFAIAANGVIGLETSLALGLRLVHEKVLSPMRLIELMSTGPARVLALPGGSLKTGAPADVTIIDPELVWTADPVRFKSKSRNCPFQGWTLKGRAIEVIVGGKVVKP